jgi:hypothetical protein
MSACKIIVGKMLGQDAVRKNENIPHSNSMKNRPIGDMSDDAEEVLRNKLKNNTFSTHIDESTYFINKSYVVAFVRFVIDAEIQENLLYCQEMPATSKGQCVFSVLSSYLETKILS